MEQSPFRMSHLQSLLCSFFKFFLGFLIHWLQSAFSVNIESCGFHTCGFLLSGYRTIATSEESPLLLPFDPSLCRIPANPCPLFYGGCCGGFSYLFMASCFLFYHLITFSSYSPMSKFPENLIVNLRHLLILCLAIVVSFYTASTPLWIILWLWHLTHGPSWAHICKASCQTQSFHTHLVKKWCWLTPILDPVLIPHCSWFHCLG